LYLFSEANNSNTSVSEMQKCSINYEVCVVDKRMEMSRSSGIKKVKYEEQFPFGIWGLKDFDSSCNFNST
jgi:hypothetical protein